MVHIERLHLTTCGASQRLTDATLFNGRICCLQYVDFISFDQSVYRIDYPIKAVVGALGKSSD
jgi:hypothetical protein